MLEPRRIDGSTPGVGCVEHILQFALEAKPVRPVPEIVTIQLQARIFDDADHIVKVSWSTRSQFHEDEVFGRAHPERQTVNIDGAAPIKHGAIKRPQ